MNTNLSISATRLINSAQHKSAHAAKELAALPVQNNKADTAEINPADPVKPMLNLKAAELETASAAKLLEADRTMLGTLLDIQA